MVSLTESDLAKAVEETTWRPENPKEVLSRMMMGGQYHIAISHNRGERYRYMGDPYHLERLIEKEFRTKAFEAVYRKMKIETRMIPDLLIDVTDASVFVFSHEEMYNMFTQVRQLKTDEDMIEIMSAMEEMKNGER